MTGFALGPITIKKYCVFCLVVVFSIFMCLVHHYCILNLRATIDSQNSHTVYIVSAVSILCLSVSHIQGTIRHTVYLSCISTTDTDTEQEKDFLPSNSKTSLFYCDKILSMCMFSLFILLSCSALSARPLCLSFCTNKETLLLWIKLCLDTTNHAVCRQHSLLLWDMLICFLVKKMRPLIPRLSLICLL